MSVFDDYFARMAPDAEVWFAEMAAEPVTAHPVVVPMDQPFSFAMDTTKLSAVISVPSELLMDHGIIPDTRPKPLPPTWRTRLRSKRAEWRERTARRAYKIIAGYWSADGEDW